MNIVLAEREFSSSSQDSRNGLGKSSLVSIIHWLLGSTVVPKVPSIEHEFVFYGELVVREHHIYVSRPAVSKSSVLVSGIPADWPFEHRPQLDGSSEFSAESWCDLLLWGWFGLTANEATGITFRSLATYLLRRDPEGYVDFMRNHPNQPAWGQQTCLAFLLGLDWTYPVKLDQNARAEKDRKATLKALTSTVASDLLGTPSNMENLKVQLDIQVAGLRSAIETFQVHDEYQALEFEADRLTRELTEIADQQLIDRAVLGSYRDSLGQEVGAETDTQQVVRMYEDAGVQLPDQVVRRLDDVVAFNRALIVNRREFLELEIAALERRIRDADRRTEELSDKRAAVMGILNTHGALDEYNKLHDQLNEAASKLNQLEYGIDLTTRLNTQKQELQVERSQLILDATNGFAERRHIVDQSIRTFATNTQALYPNPGKLHIDTDQTGYKFAVDIDRTGSHGVGRMKTFCFDLTIAQLWSQRDPSPRFLGHDSSIFEGVDSRQVASALELVAESSENLGFQYLCFMNSDAVPREDFSSNFNFDAYVRLTLTDRDESGSLFGHRF